MEAKWDNKSSEERFAICFGLILMVFTIVGFITSIIWTYNFITGRRDVTPKEAQALHNMYNQYPELRKEILEVKEDGVSYSEFVEMISKTEGIDAKRTLDKIGAK